MPTRTPAVPFRVAFTGDFRDPAGKLRYRDFGQAVFEAESRIEQRIIGEFSPELTAEQIGDAQGLVVLSPRVTRRSLAHSGELLAIARFGVGYDSVDVAACTESDVALVIAAGAVDRSVAEATLTWMLALGHHVRAKDLLVRSGDWDGRSQFMGSELRGRTLGLVGFGGIARALVPLVAPFGMAEIIAFDPHVDRRIAEQCGVRLVPLAELLRTADYVSIHCPLTDETRDLIGRDEIALLKPTAYVVNTARGGIVDEQALCEALRARRIAGAAIDVFAHEPPAFPHPLSELDNVLLAPHCIAWTDELFADIGQTVCRALLDLACGRTPRGVVNGEVLERENFRQKWARYAAPAAG